MNSCRVQFFISSCEFDPQMHFHSLCRRRLITEENHRLLMMGSMTSLRVKLGSSSGCDGKALSMVMLATRSTAIMTIHVSLVGMAFVWIIL
jgi:hypothetical protein